MTKVVQDFLWAQKVQEPIALFSDWLLVGHVDEFMTFVPAPDRKVTKFFTEVNLVLHLLDSDLLLCILWNYIRF